MRRVVVGAAVAVALAWAPGARAAGTDGQDQGTKGAQQQPGGQSAGMAPGRETGAGGSDRTSREMRADARAEQGAAKRDPFQGKKNFDVQGRVAHASSGEITIERKDLPPARLRVGEATKVQVDGKRASPDQLTPGQEVRASFNLRGGTAEAVEVKAKKPSDQDQQKLMQERQKTRQDLSGQQGQKK